MKAATAYLRGNVVLFHSESKTVTGLYVTSPPFLSIKSNAANTEIGDFTRIVLNAYVDGIPHPESWDSIDIKPLFKLAKVTSYSNLMKGAVLCNITEEKEELTLQATANMGIKGGFVPITDLLVKIPSNSPPGKVGEALMKALSLSR